jgi:ABC-type sugar transport system ATPase subunit
LGALLARRPGELSGGEQQRVALGRALSRAAVLLLDEPLAHLDGALRWEIRRELHLLQRRLHATMLYVTHDQEEAVSLADRLVVLDRGFLQQDGVPADVIDRPASIVVARSFGWPPASCFDASLRENGGRVVLASAEVELPLPAGLRWDGWKGKDVVVVLRPDGVRIFNGDGLQDTEAKLDMELPLVERLGSGWLATLQRGGWRLTMHLDRAPARSLPAAVTVALDLGAAHLFERATGRALAHGRAAAVW